MEKKKIRIIFLGKISTGKTSLMNSIIGHNYNILPITQKENTNNIFIFRYASSFIKLSESILKENENGSFFEEKDTIIELDKLSIFCFIFEFKSIISKSPFEYPIIKEKFIFL